MDLGAVFSGGVLVALALTSSVSNARDLDLEIFSSPEPARIAPTHTLRPRENAPKPTQSAVPSASPVRPARAPTQSESKVASIRSVDDRLKNARGADDLFRLEVGDLAALKRIDPSVTCYDQLCITKRTSLLSYRGAVVCLSEVTTTLKEGRLTGAMCDISIATARDINAALEDLLGSPATSQKAISAHMSWKTDKQAIELVYWKGTNMKGVPYEKWSVVLDDR